MSENKYTDKQFYINPVLVSNLDYCIKRQKKKWDNLLIIDGDEGCGKSTLSWGVGYYWAWKLGKKFTVDNVFFDVGEMLEFASKNTGEVIIWDEAAIEGLSTEWQNKIQQNLIKNLMVNRKKGHFWIFNIPKFYKLNEYIAVDRSFFLIHVFSPDNLSRGKYTFHNKNKKETIYLQYKFAKKKTYHKFKDFYGDFPASYCNIIDEEAYETKKDAMIMKLASNDKKPAKDDKTKELRKLYSTIPNVLVKDLALHAQCSTRTILKWRKEAAPPKNGEGDA